MKKSLFTVLIASLCINTTAQTPYYYYYKGEKKYLSLNTEHAFVSVQEERLPADIGQRNVKATALRSDQYARTKSESGRFYTELKMETKLSDEQYLQLLVDMKRQNREAIVAPYFKVREDGKIGLSNFFYVKLREEEDLPLIQQMAERTKSIIVRQDPFMPLWYIMSVTEASELNALECANAFYESGLFWAAEPDLMVPVVFNSTNSVNCANDPYFPDQWGLKNSGQNGGVSGVDIKACEAWQISIGSNIVVAVLDSGIDAHTDLTENMHPLNYNANTQTSPRSLHDCHGTACAGIIGAKGNNEEGIIGVAPDCKLMDISWESSGGGSASTAALRPILAAGINWAWQKGADVISNSWGYNDLEAHGYITDAIDNAVTCGRGGKGCVVVHSTGNNNYATVNYPATLPNVIAVGAIDRCGFRAGRPDKVPYTCDNTWRDLGSNYGVHLDVVAPGVGISTTNSLVKGGYNGVFSWDTLNYSNKNYTNRFYGTSAACPHVSGVAALILSVNPQLKWQQVKNIIERTAQKVNTATYTYSTTSGRPNGKWNEQVGYGLVNAHAAVLAACMVVNLENDTLSGTQTIVGNVVNVNNVHIKSGANITIIGYKQVEITSMDMEDGVYMVIGGDDEVKTDGYSPGPPGAKAFLSELAGIEDEIIIPALDDSPARLYQNYPNPFTGQTVIPYYLPDDSGSAWLRIVSINGIAVKTVKVTETGEAEIAIDANEFQPGIYFYSLIVDGQIIETRRMAAE